MKKPATSEPFDQRDGQRHGDGNVHRIDFRRIEGPTVTAVSAASAPKTIR